MNANQLMVKMVLDRWYSALKQCTTLIDSFTDEQLNKEIAPGKNRGIYLLGHLIAVHDDMIVLLNLGDKLYPELNEPFIKSPDKSVSDIPSATTLRASFQKQNELLAQKFERLQPDEWFEKHTSVSAEDFLKEPHRNKLNIIITRTTHLTYHTGQLVLLK
ncbi:MAG: DinB family protein [Bacteroidota bacterium]